MYKQSSGRNQRSKGIKVKHVLKILLLLAVCFWLVYQVKHSHDKKKEFDERDAKLSLNIDTKNEVVKLGRKDLHPLVEETAVSDEKHDEEVEEGEENTGEEEEENKHEEEEQEDDKIEEKDDDEGREGVDEEVDDPDQEKSDMENDREEDLIDDEKGREIGGEQESEGKDSENSNAETENNGALQDNNYEGTARNTHEAREENYKADDASSAVIHDTQITTTDGETGILGKSNEQAGNSILEHKNTLSDAEESNADQNTLPKVEDGETANNGSYVAVKTNEVSEITSNSYVSEESHDEFKINNNSTEMRRETRDLSLLSGNGTTSELTQVQSIVEGGESAREDSNLKILAPKPKENSTFSNKNSQYDFNSTINTKSEDRDPNHGELFKLSGDAESSITELKSNVSAEGEDISGSSVMENNDVTRDMKDDRGGIIEGSEESNSEISEEVSHDPIDLSDSSISLEEKDVRTDLETLPQIQTEGSNSEDAAAE